ncbi:MAG: hypothetical protein D4R73_00650 [Deltaproteobacteria bacterium]|nr:MAG: hypothetical protein D4R73_00650 [Deltaproteobacteria bacterium]
MRKEFLIVAIWAVALVAGCATTQGGNATPMATVAQVAATAPGLAHQLDNVYAFLVAQKAIPDNLDKATNALRVLDEVAPVVQAGAEALNQPGKFSWVQGVIQMVLAAAQILGYVAPLL